MSVEAMHVSKERHSSDNITERRPYQAMQRIREQRTLAQHRKTSIHRYKDPVGECEHRLIGTETLAWTAGRLTSTTQLTFVSQLPCRGRGECVRIIASTIRKKRRLVQKDSPIKKNDLVVITDALAGFVVRTYNFKNQISRQREPFPWT